MLTRLPIAKRALFVTSLVGLALPCVAQEPEHVTIPNRLMCSSQRSLREALRAIDYKDQTGLALLHDCHYSLGGVPALILQDSISMIKIRLFGSAKVVEYWTLPDTVRVADKR